jgi:hypothetical protein
MSDKARVHFSRHASVRMEQRGATREEVWETVERGECVVGKDGRLGFRKVFSFEDLWQGKYWKTKQVSAILREEAGKLKLETVLVTYLCEVR